VSLRQTRDEAVVAARQSQEAAKVAARLGASEARAEEQAALRRTAARLEMLQNRVKQQVCVCVF